MLIKPVHYCSGTLPQSVSYISCVTLAAREVTDCVADILNYINQKCT